MSERGRIRPYAVCAPVKAGRRITDVTEAPPLDGPRYAVDGAVLRGGNVPERPATLPHDNPGGGIPLGDGLPYLSASLIRWI